MPQSLGLNVVSRQRWSTAVIAFSVAGLMLITGSRAKAQTNYVITVDVSKADPSYPGKGITYTFKDNNGNTGPAQHLYVKQNDTVQWQVINSADITTGKATGRLHVVVLFDGRTPSPPTYAYHGLDGTPNGSLTPFPTKVVPIPDPNATYDYYVAVFDESVSPAKTYTDDPKIIVGSGQTFEVQEEIQSLEKQIKALGKKVQTLEKNEERERK